MRSLIIEIISEIQEIAETGYLPDGDGVNVPTRMWAEDVVKRIDENIKTKFALKGENKKLKMQKVTLWYRFDTKKQVSIYHHLEDGWDDRIHPKQYKKGERWIKEMAYKGHSDIASFKVIYSKVIR